jgi:hypothetical protein
MQSRKSLGIKVVRHVVAIQTSKTICKKSCNTELLCILNVWIRLQFEPCLADGKSPKSYDLIKTPFDCHTQCAHLIVFMALTESEWSVVCRHMGHAITYPVVATNTMVVIYLEHSVLILNVQNLLIQLHNRIVHVTLSDQTLFRLAVTGPKAAAFSPLGKE